ncbi:AIPR family protein [Streptomyces griseus]|uniref:AIPR family protein n=1 Tax=Streptomyces griseus TaxID=1911 RepID=UPI0004C7F928|nr:AIPR family protein [Streptomyces griseus]
MRDEGHPVVARQLRAALSREFADLIDMTDLPSAVRGPDPSRERVFLSRALAAKAVSLLTDRDPAEAAAAVIDGTGDRGVDAVVCSISAPELWLVQAKWSDRGTAAASVDDAHRLVHGLRLLADLRYEEFNARFQRLAAGVDDALASADCRIHLVLAAAGDGQPDPAVEAVLRRCADEFNTLGDLVDFRFLGLSDFHAAALRDPAPQAVSVTATLVDGWTAVQHPYQTYLGAIAVDELADWYAQHGERLYEGNVRRYLGMTKVNQELVDSLVVDPDHFWYFNNGVTVLCDEVRPHYFARPAAGQPVRLELVNARIVNGAQTAASAYHASRQDPDAAARARVMLRVVRVKDAPDGIALGIAKATNTQNRVEPRDFVALDPEQALIREDFARTLGKSYVYKRGELVPSPSTGCSIVEAATALACAHRDAGLVARVRADHDHLWRSGPDGAYPRLFGRRPAALQIWRSVRLTRAVGLALEEASGTLAGRDRALIGPGTLLLNHIAFRLVGDDDIDEPGDTWQSRADAVVGRIGAVVPLLSGLLNGLYGEHVPLALVFRDAERCRRVATEALRSLAEEGLPAPGASPFPDSSPRPSWRRPNSVRLLVDRGRIEDGTPLVFRTTTRPERRALDDWLGEDPQRYLATWVNDARTPLIWAVDGARYSPSGLVMRIWQEAAWAEAPVAVQGPRCWVLPGEGTLAELAEALLADDEAGPDE